jgi:hypothetical protein
MDRYKVYISDKPSGVTDIEELWCASEDEAITLMLDLAARNAAEVWRGSQRIYAVSEGARLEPVDVESDRRVIGLSANVVTPWVFDLRAARPPQI